MVKVPSQVVYQTNADYFASEEALSRNTLVFVDPTKKGLLWFRFLGSKTVFQLSPLGKLQVKWMDVHEKRTLYTLVKNLLVANPSEELFIKPLRQQTWVEYPVPDSFKLYWCSEATEFVLKKPLLVLTKSRSELESEKRIVELTARLAKVKNTVEELRHEFRFFREPTFNEVALKSGILNAQQLSTDLLLAGWKNESQENIKRNAEEAINLAGWLSYKEKGELNPQLIVLCQRAIDSACMDTIKKAQIILKNYPDLVPKVNSKELKWSDETRTKWIQVFGYEPPAPQTWK